MSTICETNDLLVFSHLRWDFVFQRPQHLMSRFAKFRRVYYFEDPVFGMTEIPRIHLRETQEGVQVVVPYLPTDIKPELVESSLKDLVDELIFEEDLKAMTLWYFTPTALPFSRHLKPHAVIYDCPIDCPESLEVELLQRADLVFTGGLSLYEAKKHAHHNIHPLPNSVDYGHFSQARLQLVEPEDQVNIPRPRIGYYGVIDERFDVDLLDQMAQKRPDLQFIVVGPIMLADPQALPRRHNIFYLEKKDYHALPLYLSGWDCAMMPLMMNDSTKFINPAKTLEFMAAGCPVVSTAVRDVVHPFGARKLVHIASSADEFLACIDRAMMERSRGPEWLGQIDAYLSTTTWDSTFQKMARFEAALKDQKGTGPLPEILNSVQVTEGGVV